MQREREVVRPGGAFVDAGGGEECFPTIRGAPDHGDAWTRAWTPANDGDAVEVPGTGRLERAVSDGEGTLRVDYTVTGVPGTAILHAVHLLLDLGPSARVHTRGVREAVVLDVADPRRPWPSGLDRLGPDDGSAICAVLPGCHAVTVVDGADALRLRWSAGPGPNPCSLLLWRNLGGWPPSAPYRSIGIEPMMGRTADLSTAAPREAARLGTDGRFSWTLELSASRRSRRRR
ncbi:MAG TPA: hypothetical protein VFP34_10375 [Microlunatus sp.]|nr:hypothetical protein [Microlunatus sp.]